MRIGVLALQGSFREHADSLGRLGVEAVLVRGGDQLSDLDGLILPGGESTTMGKLMGLDSLAGRIRGLARSGFPVYGTCAGMILLAREIAGSDRVLLGVMDITVRRNAFGRQVHSFEEYLAIPSLGDEPFRGIFIRAPQIQRLGTGVKALARLEGGRVVAAEQGNLLVSAFHPELTHDLRFHGYFLEAVKRHKGRKFHLPR